MPAKPVTDEARAAFERRYSERLALAAWERTLGEAARAPVRAA